MQSLLLCIAMEQNKLMRVSFIAAGLGIRVKAVNQEEWGQTIGALCGLDAPAPHPEKDRVQEALMVMAFFDSGLMDQLLKELRANGQTVRLKAVLTPHNRRWTCGALCRHLSLEAAQMGR